jgi:hypothetical protein
MPGFMPGIHDFLWQPKDVDGRTKERSRPSSTGYVGHDEQE